MSNGEKVKLTLLLTGKEIEELDQDLAVWSRGLGPTKTSREQAKAARFEFVEAFLNQYHGKAMPEEDYELEVVLTRARWLAVIEAARDEIAQAIEAGLNLDPASGILGVE